MQSVALTKKNLLPLYSLFIANAISLVGNVFTLIAIPWFVLQTTGSATKTGITGFFNILPVVLAGFLGGTIVDRLGYKRTSIISDLASGVTTALVPILSIVIMVMLTNFLDAIFGGVLQPVYVKEVYGNALNLGCLFQRMAAGRSLAD